MTGPWLILAITLASMSGAGAAMTCQRILVAMRGECPGCGRPRKATTR